MKLNLHPLFLGLAIAVAAPTAFACEDHVAGRAWTDAEVRSHLAANGYREINDVNFEEGVWTADALSLDGKHVEITLDPATGKIITDAGVATVSRESITASLAAQGYTNIHDIDFENGVWKVEAHDPAGRDVELKVDPDNGKILGTEMDRIQN